MYVYRMICFFLFKLHKGTEFFWLSFCGHVCQSYLVEPEPEPERLLPFGDKHLPGIPESIIYISTEISHLKCQLNRGFFATVVWEQ